MIQMLRSGNLLLFSVALKSIPQNIPRTAMSTSVKEIKLEYFKKQLSDGWNPNGTFKVLHHYMPHRRSFILDELGRKGVVKQGNRPLDGLKILDVGCGVGLITEMMAALGADAIGIDPTEAAIEMAKQHAQTHSPSLLPRLQYYASTAEQHVVNNMEKYDVIIAFFVLEHINHPEEFLNNCLAMLKTNGSIFIQNANRTFRCHLWILTWHIYVTKLLPKKLSTYSQLLSTNHIITVLKSSGCELVNTQSINATLKGDGFCVTKSSNYLNTIHAVKRGD